MVYLKIVSGPLKNKKKKSTRAPLIAKVQAYCYQNGFIKPETIQGIVIVKTYYLDEWNQRKMSFIANGSENSIGKSIFWQKGNTIIDGYQLTTEDIEINLSLFTEYH